MSDQREDLWEADKAARAKHKDAVHRLPNGDVIMMDGATCEAVLVPRHEVRTIQDEEIRDMIDFWKASGYGRITVNNTCAMLEELLKLRERVRKDA